ncbi:hypothetical protein H8E77_32595 [bacterium]|nr:hypothetical protein [bacterium]
MNNVFISGVIVWTPRILVILFAAFISLFALDEFGEKRPFFEKILGFFVHLIPTFFIILSVIIAWRYKLIGGVLLALVGIVFMLFFKTYTNIGRFAMLSLPLFLTGALFIISYFI